MKKHTYRYNPHTLRYEKVIVGVREKVKQISFSLLFGVVLGVLLLVIGFNFFTSPKEKALEREVAQYRRQIERLNRRIDRNDRVLTDLQQRDQNVYRLIFQAEPIHAPSLPDYNAAQTNTIDLISLTTERLDSLSARLYAQSISIDQVFQMASTKQERLSSMPAIMPIAKNRCKLVSGFGSRYHPILHYRRMHTGVDLSAKKGTPIYATGDGVVEVSGSGGADYSGYGVVCVVNHGFGFKTLYGHMTDVKVRKGQRVKRGELIGHVGSTGLSQAPHLHYEVLQNGKRVNPVYFFYEDLTPAEYEEIIELAKQENQCLS